MGNPDDAAPTAQPLQPVETQRVDKIVLVLERLTGQQFDKLDPATLPRLVI